MEIRNICKMQLQDNRSVAFNEYGTNMWRNKFDSLAVIEAKFAMKNMKGVSMQGGQDSQGCGDMKRVLTTVEEEPPSKETSVEEGGCPSPTTGTQDPPACDWSSQEEIATDREKMGPIEKEKLIEMEGTTHSSPIWELRGQSQDNLNSEGEERNDTLPNVVQQLMGTLSDATVALTVCTTKAEENRAAVNQEDEGEGDHTVTKGTTNITGSEKNLGAQDQDQIRQSSRLKEQGMGGLKIAEKAELATRKRNLEETLDCATGSWPIKYLGVPVSGSRLHVADWLQIDEKMIKRLEGWQGLQKEEGRLLTEAGAEAMKKATMMFHKSTSALGNSSLVLRN
ncbi:unnamed protein product [Urochloa humidicola]